MKIYQKLLIISFCISVFQTTLIAQSPGLAWVRTAGSTANSEAVVNMVLDSNKAVVAAGVFYNKVNFDSGSDTFNLISNGNQDIFITKYTSNGNFVWGKSIGGKLDDFVANIKKDRQGNLYLIGIFQSTVDFDPGPGVFNVTSVSTTSFILKLDKDGNFLWVKTLKGRCSTLDIDEEGNILIGGSFTGTVDFDSGPGVFNMTAQLLWDDMFVLKIDQSGNFLWAKQIRNLGESEQQEYGLETDPSGNVFFAGDFTNTLDFDPGPATDSLTSHGLDDAFILKLSSEGDFQWVKQFGGTGSDKVSGLAVDKDGNVFSTGFFHGTVDFDPGASSFSLISPASARSAFISKLTGSGNFVYAKSFQSGDSFGQAITIDSANNVFISGGFHGTVDFDPGPGISTMKVGEMFIVKLDKTGDFVSGAGFSPTDSTFYWESIYSSIHVDAPNNIYYAGSFPGTVDFDPGAGFSPISSNGAWDMFLLKLGTTGCSTATREVQNAQGCGNYVWNGVTYNRSGQYYQQLSNSAGCDSIIQLNLVLTSIQTSLEETSCGPYVWRNQVFNSSGIYIDTIRSSSGCDSIFTLRLTVHPIPTPTLNQDTSICEGDQIKLSTGTFSSYLWNTGDSSSFIYINHQGVYWVNVTDVNGCSGTDSTVISSHNCLPCTDPKLIEKIYPTPVNDILIVKIKSSTCELRMDLYNELGQLIMKGRSLQPGINTVSMKKFPPAGYFYKIYFQNIIVTQGKILKE
jgi:hypothetical protein